MKRITEISPVLKARVAGALYVLIFVAAPSGASAATPVKMLVTLICDTLVALLLYDLLRPVNGSLSFLAAFFRLSFVAVMAIYTLNYFGPAVILKGGHSPATFNSGYNVALIFFGIHCLLIGYLIFRSSFLPRMLGVLMAVAGLTYLINSLASYLAPAFANAAIYYFVASWLVAEGSLTLWLLIVAVNKRRWEDQARGGTL